MFTYFREKKLQKQNEAKSRMEFALSLYKNRLAVAESRDDAGKKYMELRKISDDTASCLDNKDSFSGVSTDGRRAFGAVTSFIATAAVILLVTPLLPGTAFFGIALYLAIIGSAAGGARLGDNSAQKATTQFRAKHEGFFKALTQVKEASAAAADTILKKDVLDFKSSPYREKLFDSYPDVKDAFMRAAIDALPDAKPARAPVTAQKPANT